MITINKLTVTENQFRLIVDALKNQARALSAFDDSDRWAEDIWNSEVLHQALRSIGRFQGFKE